MRILVERMTEAGTLLTLIPGRSFRKAPVPVFVPLGEDLRARALAGIKALQGEGTQLEVDLRI